MKIRYYHYKATGRFVEQIIEKRNEQGYVLYCFQNGKIHKLSDLNVVSLPFIEEPKKCKEITKEQVEEIIFLHVL